MNKKLLLLAMALGISATAGTCMRRRGSLEYTHGPILGRPGAHQMGIWMRTSEPGQFRVMYLPASLDGVKMGSTPLVSTTLEHDNAAWVLLEGLNLSGAAPGDYELIALPALFGGRDGAPARAILRPL